MVLEIPDFENGIHRMLKLDGSREAVKTKAVHQTSGL